MPVYSTPKTYRAGFYDNKRTNGVDDRKYTAEDLRKPYDVVFSDGILPDEDCSAGDNLQVIAAGGMKIYVDVGHAKLGGAWFENEKPYYITLDDATAARRYDYVIIRNDNSDEVRAPNIYVVSSSTNYAPSSMITRDENIYEICVAKITVGANVIELKQNNIDDCRSDSYACPLMRGVGATVTRTYRNTVYSTQENQTYFSIGISQFDKETDVLNVYIEGVKMSSSDYHYVTDTSLYLKLGVPVVNTKVEFEVIKNVNGGKSADATGEYLALMADVNVNKKKLEHHYYCNGINDNIELSKLAQSWLNNADYSSRKVVIHGVFGASVAYAGSGTAASPYKWLCLGINDATRRIVFDFTDCTNIDMAFTDGTYNVIFDGLHVDIIGANVIAIGGQRITMFTEEATAHISAERCRFFITSNTGFIARGGTFRDCLASVTTHTGNACCFNIKTGGLLRLFGGEHYAYAKTGKEAAVILIEAGQTGIVSTYSINCPTVEKSGYVQTYAINCLAGDACCSFADTITKLAIEATGQNVRGTIAASIAGTI